MNKQTKITLQELLRRKEQMLESKKIPKTRELYINSKDAQEMENGDAYLVYQCVTEPCLKSRELQESFGCVEPMEIVEKIFDPGEIPQISVECLRLSGYIDGVKAVDEIKN